MALCRRHPGHVCRPHSPCPLGSCPHLCALDPGAPHTSSPDSRLPPHSSLCPAFTLLSCFVWIPVFAPRCLSSESGDRASPTAPALLAHAQSANQHPECSVLVWAFVLRQGLTLEPRLARISLDSPSELQTHGLPPVSASWVLGLQSVPARTRWLNAAACS